MATPLNDSVSLPTEIVEPAGPTSGNVESVVPTIEKPDAPATPPPSVKPTKVAEEPKGYSYTSPKIDFEKDPPGYLKAKVESLIYWENPKKSAIALASSLTVLVMTQYYSLLQIIAGVFTLVTGLNWVYVNTHKQGQRFISGKAPEALVNPHSGRLENKGSYIPRDRVLRGAHVTVDVAEAITQQITKLVLIEDNWRSAIAFVASYFVWTLAKYVSTKYLIGFFVVSAFSLPRLYLQHQEVIDSHVTQQTKNARALLEQYGGVAGQKAQEYAAQAKDFIVKKTSGAPVEKKVD